MGEVLHQFLLNLNNRVSIGIPVGPAASIVVSELVLNEVDEFLRNHRTHPTYTRYVDDFRFFSNSRSELEELWHDLSSFIYRAHRLTLANGKTRILSSLQFRDEVLSPPVNEKRRDLAERVGISFADLEDEYSRAPSKQSSTSGTLEEKASALEELFHEMLSEEYLNIGLSRQLLRRARSLRMRAIARPVLENLERIAPVIRDAGLYLDHVMSHRAISYYSKAFERFFSSNSAFSRGSHLHYWVAWLLSGKRGAAELPGLDDFLDSALPRFQARAARTFDRVAWVRNNRGQWQKWATWDRWSLLHAAEILPSRERRAWMDSVANSAELMDRLVAAKVRTM